jgi:prepilin-type N-terminal cleavage/methylation domain-containing protein
VSHRNHQSGYTLLELLITMTIIGILGLSIMNFTIQVMKGYKYVSLQSTTAVDLSNTLDRVSKVIRGSTDVVDAQTNSLTIYAYFLPNDAVVDKIKYYSSGTNLFADVTPPSGTAPSYTYSAADTKTYKISSFLAAGSPPVFTYYDDVGNQLTGSFAVNQVKQIGIQISVNPDTQTLKKDISTQTKVTLRNKKTNL